MSTATRPSAKSPPLEIDGTRERLTRLGLMHAAEALARELSEAVQHNRPAHQVLDRLLAFELTPLSRDPNRYEVSEPELLRGLRLS
jgi:hypothetical protein